MNRKIQLVIFDMDGVILDSEPLHYRAKLKIFDSLGLKETFDLQKYVGRPNQELWARVIRENGLSEKPGDLERRQYQLILNDIRTERIQATAGLPQLLESLKKCGVRMAVASSSDRWYVDTVADILEISPYFCCLTGGDEVARQKPQPDLYRKILEKTGLPASASIAVEDSELGVSAALAAGIRCLGYANPTSGTQNLSGAERKITAMDQVFDYISRDSAAGMEKRKLPE